MSNDQASTPLPNSVAPPREYMDRLLPAPHIKMVKDAILSAIRKSTLSHALAAVADELEEADFPRLKRELTDADHDLVRVFKNRIRWGTWPEDTGPVIINDITCARDAYQKHAHNNGSAVAIVTALNALLERHRAR